MTADEFDQAIVDRLERQPFRAFIIELQNGNKLEINRPFSVAIRDGVATCFSGGKIHLHIPSEQVKNVVDSPSMTNMSA